jgi:FkbM family methyltransferase
MSNLETQYAEALAIRKSLPEKNAFDIQQLQKMPAFFHWIDCGIQGGPSFAMFLAGADDGVALRFFWNGAYERHTTELWSRHAAGAANLVLDIGSHTGVYTLAALSAGATKVVSFEPHFMNYSRLLMNLRGNGHSPENAFMLGVGETNKSDFFSVPTRLDYLSTGGSVGARDNCITFPINIVSIDSFLNGVHKVDLMKIDVEGYEPNVLDGARQTIKMNKPTIFFECLNDHVGKLVQDFLAPLGYRFWIVDDKYSQLIPCASVRAELDETGQVVMSRLNRIASCKSV